MHAAPPRPAPPALPHPCTLQATWVGGSAYVAAAAAHGQVYVYSTASAKVVQKVRAHEGKNVRGLWWDEDNGLLLTCSFDRSVKVWE